MEREAFLTWLSEIDKLSEAQNVDVGEVLACRPVGEASIPAVEIGVGEDRTGLRNFESFRSLFANSIVGLAAVVFTPL